MSDATAEGLLERLRCAADARRELWRGWSRLATSPGEDGGALVSPFGAGLATSLLRIGRQVREGWDNWRFRSKRSWVAARVRGLGLSPIEVTLIADSLSRAEVMYLVEHAPAAAVREMLRGVNGFSLDTELNVEMRRRGWTG